MTYPTIRHRLLPTLTILTDTDNDVKTIITSIQTLAMSLRAVPDKGQGIVLEIVLQLSQWPITAFVYNLFCSCKIKSFDTTDSLEGNGID
jgi:hypothetical protein